MAVRRLADHQPASFEFTPENRAWAEKQIGKYPPGRQASAVLSLLWRAQAQHDYWLPKPAIEKVADMLSLPYIRVLEIATFYAMFNLAPVGRYFIQLCGTTPCVLCGSNDIKAVLRNRVGESGQVSADGKFSWVEVECLGACCNAPMVQINDDYYEDLTPQNFILLLDNLAAGRPVKKGSQIGRMSSEPTGGLTTLISFYGVDGRGLPAGSDQRPSAPDYAAGLAEKSVSDSVAAPPRSAQEHAIQEGVHSRGRPGTAEQGLTTRAEVPVGQSAQASQDAISESVARGRQPGSAPTERTDVEAVAGHEPQPAFGSPLSNQDAHSEVAEIHAKLAKLPANATPQERADAVGRRPAALGAPRRGEPDDLKRIRGIGQANEARLHDLGIFHFDQIAAWTPTEIRWVGTYLAFSGRIDRENWVGQARKLVADDKTRAETDQAPGLADSSSAPIGSSDSEAQ